MRYFKKNTNSAKTSGIRLAKLSFGNEFKDLKGIYFSNGKVAKSSKDSYNKTIQKELWHSSLELLSINQVTQI